MVVGVLAVVMVHVATVHVVAGGGGSVNMCTGRLFLFSEFFFISIKSEHKTQ